METFGCPGRPKCELAWFPPGSRNGSRGARAACPDAQCDAALFDLVPKQDGAHAVDAFVNGERVPVPDWGLGLLVARRGVSASDIEVASCDLVGTNGRCTVRVLG